MLSLFIYSLFCKHLRAAENLAKNIQQMLVEQRQGQTYSSDESFALVLTLTR